MARAPYHCSALLPGWLGRIVNPLGSSSQRQPFLSFLYLISMHEARSRLMLLLAGTAQFGVY